MAPSDTVTPRPPVTRPSGWPVLRTPRWMLLGTLVLVGGLVAAAIPHHPSAGQRAADLRSLVRQLGTDIESCAGGVTDSLIALRSIQAGASHDLGTAVKIANHSSANCSAANNMQIEDLVQVQVPESLASFRLDRAVLSLRQWAAPDAVRVCADVAALLRGPAISQAALRADLAALDAERARFDDLLGVPNRSLGAHLTLPDLPG